MVTLVKGNGIVPVFDTVTVCAGLVVLIAWFGNGIVVGDTVYVGTMTFPVNVIDCEVAGATTVTFSVALLANGFADVGLNVTLTTQVAPTAIATPIEQLLV